MEEEAKKAFGAARKRTPANGRERAVALLCAIASSFSGTKSKGLAFLTRGRAKGHTPGRSKPVKAKKISE